MYNIHIIFTIFIITFLATWKAPLHSFSQGQLAYVVLKALPTYNKDGQNLSSREPLFYIPFSKRTLCKQPTISKNVTAKVTGSSPSVYTMYISSLSTCVSGSSEGKAV